MLARAVTRVEASGMHRPGSIFKLIRRGLLVLGLVAGMAQADAAVAYWQTGGVGTPRALVSDLPLRVNQTAKLLPVTPGRPAQTLTGDFDNRSATPAHIAAVRVSIASVTKASGAAAGTCDASDFTLAGHTMKVDADIASADHTGPGPEPRSASTTSAASTRTRARAQRSSCATRSPEQAKVAELDQPRDPS